MSYGLWPPKNPFHMLFFASEKITYEKLGFRVLTLKLTSMGPGAPPPKESPPLFTNYLGLLYIIRKNDATITPCSTNSINLY